MWFMFAADLILVVHLFFIIFVLLGGFLCLHRANWAWLHLPAMIWGIWVEWAGLVCPLTPLENHFRQKASGQGYTEDFVGHYLLPVIYPQDLTIEIQWLLGFLVLSVNIIVYLFVWWKRTKQRREVDG